MSFDWVDGDQLPLHANENRGIIRLNNEMNRLESGLACDRYNVDFFNDLHTLSCSRLVSDRIASCELHRLRNKHRRLIELHDCLAKFHKIDEKFVEIETELAKYDFGHTKNHILKLLRSALDAMKILRIVSSDDVKTLRRKHADMLNLCEPEIWIVDYADIHLHSSRGCSGLKYMSSSDDSSDDDL